MKSPIRRLSALVASVGICVFAYAASAADQFDILTHPPSPASNIVYWRIDHPNVTKHETLYPQIQFQPGDYVTVVAGGCAQTGGHGKTWKRYVDPQGPEADKYYHGLIHIPGVTTGLIRLQNFGMGNEYHVDPHLPAAGLILHLGYDDDNYKDNGYWGRNGDDGTGDQCKGLADAYVIVVVRHGGVGPAPLPPIGIPHNVFRHEGAWRFLNFDTNTMSWDSFTCAFDLGWSDYANPVTYAEFYFGRGMASSGNCMGMCLLACAGEKQWALEDKLVEQFWLGFTQHQPIDHDINVAHWRQLSTYFLEHWAHSMFDSPTTTAGVIERDIAAKNYGMISMAHGWGGHVIVPLAVEHKGNQILIHVYDPNRPCTGLPDNDSNLPPMVIQGDHWSFPMVGGETWNDSNGHIAYIPYQINSDWSNLANGLSDAGQIIFGAGTTVEQITDSTGRKLYLKPRANGVHEVDGSNNGLGHDVVRMMQFHAAVGMAPASKPARYPGFYLKRSFVESPQMAQMAVQMNNDFSRDYGTPQEVYCVLNRNLKDLKFEVSSQAGATPVHFLVGHRGQFYEVQTQAADNKTAISPDFVVHSMADLSSGVTLHDRNNVAHKAVLTCGLFHADTNEMHIQKTAPVNAGKDLIELKVSADRDLTVQTAGTPEDLQVDVKIVDANGAKAGTSRKAPMLKAP
jgi:hypothetical protein